MFDVSICFQFTIHVLFRWLESDFSHEKPIVAWKKSFQTVSEAVVEAWEQRKMHGCSFIHWSFVYLQETLIKRTFKLYHLVDTTLSHFKSIGLPSGCYSPPPLSLSALMTSPVSSQNEFVCVCVAMYPEGGVAGSETIILTSYLHHSYVRDSDGFILSLQPCFFTRVKCMYVYVYMRMPQYSTDASSGAGQNVDLII